MAKQRRALKGEWFLRVHSRDSRPHVRSLEKLHRLAWGLLASPGITALQPPQAAAQGGSLPLAHTSLLSILQQLPSHHTQNKISTADHSQAGQWDTGLS